MIFPLKKLETENTMRKKMSAEESLKAESFQETIIKK